MNNNATGHDLGPLEKELKEFISLKTQGLKESDNILIETKKGITLQKFKGIETHTLNPFIERIGEKVFQIKSNKTDTRESDENKEASNTWRKKESKTHKDTQQQISRIFYADFLGTSSITMEKNEDLDTYLISEKNNNLFLPLLHKYTSEQIENVEENFNIITKPHLIKERLEEITGPEYFKKNLLPFIEEKPSELEQPTWHTKNDYKGFLKQLLTRQRTKPAYANFSTKHGIKWANEIAAQGGGEGIIYIGSPNEIWIFKIKNEDIGKNTKTYINNTKQEPLHIYNSSIQNPPYTKSLYEEPFILTHIEQGITHPFFNGEPELITTDLNEAEKHMRKTNFHYFVENLIKKYEIATKEFKT